MAATKIAARRTKGKERGPRAKLTDHELELIRELYVELKPKCKTGEELGAAIAERIAKRFA